MQVYKIVFAKKIDSCSEFVEKQNITETNFSTNLKRLFDNYSEAVKKYNYKVVKFYISNSQLDKIFNLIAVDDIIQPENKEYLHLSNSFRKHKTTESIKNEIKQVITSYKKEEAIIGDDLPF